MPRPQQTAQLVADASHQLEVVTEQVNEAKVQLDQQQAAVAKADQGAADAQARLDALDGQIRQLARSAYTSDGFSRLDVMLTSSSADEFVHQLGTLDAIAGHTNEQVAAGRGSGRRRGEGAGRRRGGRGAGAEVLRRHRRAAEGPRGKDRRLPAPVRRADRAAAGRRSLATHGGARPCRCPARSSRASGAAQTAVDTALAQVGEPYVWGAGGPDAFDCSGLTQYAYSAAGVSLPHSSSSQSRMGTPVSRDQLQPGDLVFFYSPVSHVGMYIGNGQMVHASTSGQPVKVASLDSMGGYNSARRIG